MNIAIVLSGGTGTRVGENIPKQFIEVLGKPVIAYTLEILQEEPMIDEILIVSHKDWIEHTYSIVNMYNISKVSNIVEGGNTFLQSHIKGVESLKCNDDDIVVTVFASSPLLLKSDIEDSIRVCQEHGNGIAAKEIDLCTGYIDENNSSVKSVIRETLRGFACPWSFKFGELRDAFEQCKDKIDSLEQHTTSVYYELGKRLWFSKFDSIQTKITTKNDLLVFEALMEKENDRRNKEESR